MKLRKKIKLDHKNEENGITSLKAKHPSLNGIMVDKTNNFSKKKLRKKRKEGRRRLFVNEIANSIDSDSCYSEKLLQTNDKKVLRIRRKRKREESLQNSGEKPGQRKPPNLIHLKDLQSKKAKKLLKQAIKKVKL